MHDFKCSVNFEVDTFAPLRATDYGNFNKHAEIKHSNWLNWSHDLPNPI